MNFFFTSIAYDSAWYTYNFWKIPLRHLCAAGSITQEKLTEGRRGALVSVERALSQTKGRGKRGRRNSSSSAHRGEGTGDHMKEGHVGSGIWSGEDIHWGERGEADHGMWGGKDGGPVGTGYLPPSIAAAWSMRGQLNTRLLQNIPTTLK